MFVPPLQAQFKVGDGVLWKERGQGGDVYLPGTITYINLDGTFAVKYEWADKFGKNETTKHQSHVFATKLRVRERSGTGFRCVCVCACVCVCVCGCSRLWS